MDKDSNLSFPPGHWYLLVYILSIYRYIPSLDFPAFSNGNWYYTEQKMGEGWLDPLPWKEIHYDKSWLIYYLVEAFLAGRFATVVDFLAGAFFSTALVSDFLGSAFAGFSFLGLAGMLA